MKEFMIYTDGDVDLPSPYDKEVILLPQYYYFDDNMIYGDERVLSREEFFEQLRTRRAYTSGVNPALVREKFENTLKDGKDILCITVSSGLSGSYNTIRMTALDLKGMYPDRSIEVIDSLSATLAAGFLCMDALDMKKQGKTLQETSEEIRKRVRLIDVYFVVDNFKYLVQGGRVPEAVGKIGDILDIKLTLTMKDGRIVPYKKNRGMNNALRNIQNIAQSKETVRIGAIHVGNADMFNRCKSLVSADCEAYLNLIVSSHVGPDTTGLAIEWREPGKA